MVLNLELNNFKYLSVGVWLILKALNMRNILSFKLFNFEGQKFQA